MDATSIIALITKILTLATEYGPKGIEALKEIAAQFTGGTAILTLEQLTVLVDAKLTSQDLVSAHLQAHQRPSEGGI